VAADPESFVLRDAAIQALAYVYFEDPTGPGGADGSSTQQARLLRRLQAVARPLARSRYR
jgi:hypothetical protein